MQSDGTQSPLMRSGRRSQTPTAEEKQRKERKKSTMKARTTQKEIKNSYKNIISVPYCALQNLLNYQNPVAYTTRREGWASDIYSIDGIAISMGYAPFGNIKPSYSELKAVEDAAEKIRYSNSPYTEIISALNNLLSEFVKTVTTK